MKHWTEQGPQASKWRDGTFDKAIDMLAHDDDTCSGRIIRISASGGVVTFTEGCDDYFSTSMPKADAVELLTEALEWLKALPDHP